MSTAATVSLWETTFSETPQVDREAGVIRGVKILGRTSRNQRVYAPGALHAAARLYEGLAVNVDHPHGRTPAAPRQVAEGLGWLSAIRVTDEGVYGDLHYLRSHPQAEMIVEAAERNPWRFGLSHNAEGRVVKQGQEWVVESVERVHSVDVVQSPATNRGLFESCDPSAPPTLRELCARVGCSQLLNHPQLTGLGELPVQFSQPSTANVTASLEGTAEQEAPLGPVAPSGTPAGPNARLMTGQEAGGSGEFAPTRNRVAAGLQEANTGGSLTDVLATLLPALAQQPGQPPASDWSSLFAHLAVSLRESLGTEAHAIASGVGSGGVGTGARGQTAAGEPAAGPGPGGDLHTRLTRLESELHCRGLLEQTGRGVDPERLAALMALSDDSARRALLETWPAREPARSRPAASPPRYATEPLRMPADVQGFLAALR